MNREIVRTRCHKSAVESGLVVVSLLGLLGVLILSFSWRLPDLNWQIALNGWSPIDWVSHLNSPEQFRLDFSNGSNLYDKSSFMYVYPLADRWFGVPPEKTIPVIIFAEMVFLAAACVHFAKSLTSGATLVGGVLFALLVVASPARDMDLSHFAAPFFWGLFYNIADGLRIFGISLFLRKRTLLGGLLLGLSFTVHPIMALMGCAFLVGFLAAHRVDRGCRAVAGSALAFTMVAGGWLLSKFDYSSVSAYAIDPHVWVDMARTFSFHFFPIDYGTLTVEFESRLLPLIVLCLLAMHYLPTVVEEEKLRRGLVGASIMLIALTVVGLLVSVYLPIPALVKLALPRASALLILLALAIVSAGLWQDIANGKLHCKILALFLLISPFISPPGFPLIPAMALVLLRPRGGRSAESEVYRQSERVLLVCILATVAFGGLSGFVQIHHAASLIGGFRKWEAILLLVVVVVILHLIETRGDVLAKRRVVWKCLALAGVIVATCYMSLLWHQENTPPKAYRSSGVAYLAAQRWAKHYSSENALFLVDPTIYYGWRDFSERSSFGNLREWLHTSWLYDSRLERYQDGIRRFAELGIPLGPYLKESAVRAAGFNLLHRDVQRRFYELDDQWFRSLRDRYGVSYLVLARSHTTRSYSFEPVFENEHYVIYDLRRQAE